MQKKDFFLCGFTGWCLEILWTGLQNLSSDVPCLRTCSTDPSGLLQACPLSGYGTGDHLQLRDFFRGIFKRIFFSEASHLSLGLFSCSASV